MFPKGTGLGRDMAVSLFWIGAKIHWSWSRLRGARLSPLLMALMLLPGCGGGGAPSGNSTAHFLTAEATQDSTSFDVMTLSWATNVSVAEGFRLEGKVEGGAYQPLTQGLISLDFRSARITFDPSTPELTNFAFRITAVMQNQDLVQAETTFRRTLRPVYGVTVTHAPNFSGAEVTWSRNSDSRANGFRVEIREPGSAWQVVPGEVALAYGGSLGQWVPELRDGGAYELRVVPTFAGEAGFAWTINTRAPLLAPRALCATPSGGGFRLSWSNVSAGATGLKVVRRVRSAGEGSWGAEVVLATLGPGVSEYVDYAIPPGARYAYRIVATLEGAVDAPSTWMVAGTPSESLGGAFERAGLALGFKPALRDAEGAWIGSTWSWGQSQTRVRLMRSAPAAGFPRTIPFSPGATISDTGSLQLQAMPQGGLRVAGVESINYESPLSLRTLTSVNGAWRENPLHPIEGIGFSGKWGFDGQYCGGYLTSERRFGFLQTDGLQSPQAELLPAGWTQMSYGWWDRLPDGRPVGLIRVESGWALAIRSLQGDWSAQSLDGLAKVGSLVWDLRGFQVDSTGRIHAMFTQAPSDLRGRYLLLTPGQAPTVEDVPLVDELRWGTVYAMAATPSGGRLGFALLDDAGQLTVVVRDVDGRWSRSSGLVSGAQVNYRDPFLLCGFTSVGRFWVLHDEVETPEVFAEQGVFELLEESVRTTP